MLRNLTSPSRIMWNIFSKTGKNNSVPVRGETLTIVSTTCQDKQKKKNKEGQRNGKIEVSVIEKFSLEH